jgi:hypothetical protein
MQEVFCRLALSHADPENAYGRLELANLPYSEESACPRYAFSWCSGSGSGAGVCSTVVISLSGAWERPAGDTPPAGYLRNIEPVAGRV